MIMADGSHGAISRIALSLIFGLLAALPSQAFREDRAVQVAVISVNDFHASFLTDTAQGVPGAGNLWLCIDSLRRVYPNNVVVSAGDNFGGSYFSIKTEDRYIPWLFEKLGITLSIVGNHEFDNGQAFLSDRWQSEPDRPSDWKLTYVCANVTDSTGRIPDYFTPVAVCSIPIGSSERVVRIAFAGLVTATTPEQAVKAKVAGLSFSPDYAGVINGLYATDSTRALLDSADIRLLGVHIGTDMEGGKAVWSLSGDAGLFEGTDTSPYHGMLSGHSHKLVNGTLLNLPVVQGDCYGRYVSVMRFEVDTVSGEVSTLPSELCRVPFSSSRDSGKLAIETRVDSLLQHTMVNGRPLGEILTYATDGLQHDRNKPQAISPLGGYVCSAYAYAAGSILQLKPSVPVIGMCHIGGIRANIERGDVRVIDAGQVLPFANDVSVFRMTGRQLRELLQFGLNNRKYGRLQSSSLTIYADTIGGGRWPKYNIRRIVYHNVHTGKSEKVKDKKMYYVAADDFMTHGGDGYPEEIFDKTRLSAAMPLTSEAFFTYLKTFDIVSPRTTHATKVIIKRK